MPYATPGLTANVCSTGWAQLIRPGWARLCRRRDGWQGPTGMELDRKLLYRTLLFAFGSIVHWTQLVNGERIATCQPHHTYRKECSCVRRAFIVFFLDCGPVSEKVPTRCQKNVCNHIVHTLIRRVNEQLKICFDSVHLRCQVVLDTYEVFDFSEKTWSTPQRLGAYLRAKYRMI